ncbi:hypothetical protein [Caballeronia sp. ATUFL_M2_KS44]|uniref:hypothetical protein n=1 Tax=Caballeronia sp. ATUFL_M2_KS44 TaxID=2921767 RepID=UPI0020297F67|nr:hypothetical protein [Caballeronia sp. ATUFL_M2_KS44]
MFKVISAILWRKCNQATFDSLNGTSRGQYDIRLTRRAFEGFFKGIPKTNPTKLGGFDLVVPIQPFTGTPSVPETEITVRYMGDDSQRKDWNIPSQRPDTAYALWAPGRGVDTTFDIGKRDYALIIRDVDGGFHARWIKDAEFEKLPGSVRALMTSAEVGWEECE